MKKITNEVLLRNIEDLEGRVRALVSREQERDGRREAVWEAFGDFSWFVFKWVMIGAAVGLTAWAVFYGVGVAWLEQSQNIREFCSHLPPQ